MGQLPHGESCEDMWSGFEGDKDVFEEDCTLLECAIFVVTSLLSRLRRTENMGK